VDPLAAVHAGPSPTGSRGIGTAFATIFAAVAINREVQRRREEQAAGVQPPARATCGEGMNPW
jgi:NAD(P)-dependent dehydrogenase (short-subunit alcohol dehydrogenase family)